MRWHDAEQWKLQRNAKCISRRNWCVSMKNYWWKRELNFELERVRQRDEGVVDLGEIVFSNRCDRTRIGIGGERELFSRAGAGMKI